MSTLKFIPGQRVQLTQEAIKAKIHVRQDRSGDFRYGVVVNTREEIGLITVLCDGEYRNFLSAAKWWEPEKLEIHEQQAR